MKYKSLSQLVKEPDWLQEYMMLDSTLSKFREEFGGLVDDIQETETYEELIDYLDVLWSRMSSDEIDYFNNVVVSKMNEENNK